MQQSAQFQDMVRMQMRYENQLDGLQIDARIGQSARHAVPAIHHDPAATEPKG